MDPADSKFGVKYRSYISRVYSAFLCLKVKTPMKYVVFGMALLSSMAASAQMSMTQKVLKPVIEYQCAAELKDSKLWKASTYFMQDTNKLKLQNEVCGCIGEHALENVPAKTLLQATINDEVKNQVVRQAMLNSLKGCLLAAKK